MKKVLFSIMMAMAFLMVSCSNDDLGEGTITQPTEETFEKLSNASIEEFLSFAKTPRLGFHLEKAKAYMEAWAQKHGYTAHSDSYGNVWMDVPANNEAMASLPKVILQGHLDMVCASKSGETYDYETVVGEPYYEGDLLKGRKVNLGADDGVGVGVALAIAGTDVAHGPLRLLFTANEDYDMSGAAGLANEVLDANYLINIDSEEAGQVCIGSLGCYTVDFAKTYVGEKLDNTTKVLNLSVTGLLGGHSGLKIGEHRLSAATVTFDVCNLIGKSNGHLLDINCGIADNVIANSTKIRFAVPADKESECRKNIETLMATYKSEYANETSMAYQWAEGELTEADVACPSQLNDLLGTFIKNIPQGVIERNGDIPTKSNNIGIITLSGGTLKIKDMFRSFDNQWVLDEKDRLLAEATKMGMSAKESAYTPSWDTPNKSPLKEMILKYYQEVNPKAYVEKAKGTLKCAYFVIKNPHLYAVSVGPQVDDAHTIDETVHVSTVKPLVKTIVNTLQHIGEITE